MQRRAWDAQLFLQIGRARDLARPVFDQHRLQLGGSLHEVPTCLPRHVLRTSIGYWRAACDSGRQRMEELRDKRGPIVLERTDSEALRRRQERKSRGHAACQRTGRNQGFGVQQHTALHQHLLHRFGYQACQGLLRNPLRRSLKSGHAFVVWPAPLPRRRRWFKFYSGKQKLRRQQAPRPGKLLACIVTPLILGIPKCQSRNASSCL